MTKQKRPFKENLLDVTNIEPKYLDISYATLSERQKLDIYLPSVDEGRSRYCSYSWWSIQNGK